MKRCVLLLILVTLSLANLGCDVAGSAVSDDDFKRVQLGMSEDEVVAILGKPDEAITHPQVRSLRMLEWGEDSRVVLDNGRVDSVILHDEKILDSDTAAAEAE